MRIGFVIVGAIVAVVGVALLYVPVFPQSAQTVTAKPGVPSYYVGNVSQDSLTGKIPVSISWTATTTVTVIGGACTSHCTNFSDLSDITLETGMSGSFMVDQPVGGSIFLGANTSTSSGSVTFKATIALTTAGSLLVILGLLILVAGALLRRTKASPAIATVPAPGAAAPAPTPTAPANPAE